MGSGMRVFICTRLWGWAAIIVAETEEQARGLLNIELAAHGLDPSKPYTLRELDTTTPAAQVLLDGDY